MTNLPEDQPWVPVVSKTGKVLMPCSPRRARRLLRKGSAKPKWKDGFYYIQLTEREDGDTQDVIKNTELHPEVALRALTTPETN